MKKLVALAVVALSGIAVGVGSAAQPTNPGCFGKDRAAAIGSALTGAEWGVIAGDRAGDNGTINQNYKTSCGGDPA